MFCFLISICVSGNDNSQQLSQVVSLGTVERMPSFSQVMHNEECSILSF